MSARIPPATGLFATAAATAAKRQFGAEMVENTRIMAQHPRLLMAYGRYNSAVERASGVPETLRHLAVLKTATLVECEFCIDISSEFARRAGVTDDQLLALPNAAESGLFSADQLLVLEFATAMTRCPVEVDDALFTRLNDRFGVKPTIELGHLVAW